MLKNRGVSLGLSAASASLGLALTVSLAAMPRAQAGITLLGNRLAQAGTAPAFTPPTAAPSGTQVRITGSTSLSSINQSLEQRFESQFPGTQVNVQYGDAAAALQQVLNGNADVAALGRALTPQEKDQGLVEVPVARGRIALIVGPENPFRGSLTIEQFAQIFRGEITNWSQVGGPDLPIRLIDRPDSSDTRQAFQAYEKFQTAPFVAGGNVVKLSEDSTEAVIRELGRDGLGYAIADQVINQPGVQVLDMYGTLPTDPLYPFSQPLNYVYRRNNPPPPVQIFLGYATSSEVRAAIEAARPQNTAQAAAPGTVAPGTGAATPGAVGTAPATGTAAPGGAVPGAATPGTAAPVTGTATPGTPASDPAVGAGASPAVSPIPSPATVAPAGGEPVGGGQSSPTAVPADGTAAAPAVGTPWWVWLLLPLLGGLLWFILRGRGGEADEGEEAIAAGEGMPNVAAPVDLGSTAGGVAPVNPEVSGAASAAPFAVGLSGAAAAAAAVTGMGAQPAAPATAAAQSRIILVPRDCRNAYAYWEVSEAQKGRLREQGGERLLLRLYEVIPSDQGAAKLRGVKQFQCNEGDSDRHFAIPIDDRDYLVELGYLGVDGGWLLLTRSKPAHVPACAPPSDAAPDPAQPESARIPPLPTTSGRLSDAMSGLTASLGQLGDSAASLGAATVGAGMAAVGTAAATLGDRTPTPETQESRIILVPRNAHDAYVYWEVAEAHKAALRQQGGQKLMLRLYDVTDLDPNQNQPLRFQQFECSEEQQEFPITVPSSDRDYQVELGYLTADNHWLSLARSAPMPFFSTSEPTS